MPEINEPTFFDKYSDGLFLVIGALIATATTLIIPFVTKSHEKKKEKQRVKVDLFNAVYTFYNLRKAELVYSNETALHNANAIFFYNTMNGKDVKEDVKKTASDGYNNSISCINSHKEGLMKSFENLVEIEGKIIGLLVEVQDVYGTEMYKSLNSLIEPEIEKSNTPSNLHNYKEATPVQLRDYAKTLSAELKIASFALHTKWKEMRKEMNAVFPKT